MEDIHLQLLLNNIITALKNDVRPGIQSDKAESALNTVIRLLSRMQVNCPDEDGLAIDTPLRYLRQNPVLAVTRNQSVPAPIEELMELAQAEGQVLARVEEQAEQLFQSSNYDESGLSASLSPGQVEQQRQGIEAWLQQHYGDSAIAVSRFQYVVGGRTKQTAFMDIVGIEDMPKTVVVRIDGAVNLAGGKSVTFEYPLQQLLANQGMKVPRPILLESDTRIVGKPFMLVELMPGKMAGSYFMPPAIDSVLATHAAELATLHNIPIELISSLSQINKPPQEEDLLAELDDLESLFRGSGSPSSYIIDAAFAWLRENIALAFLGSPCLAHRDPVFHNVLMENDQVTAILDWELARISYPAEDLGYIRAAVTQVMPWQTYMEHYKAVGGATIDQRQVDYYAVFSLLRNGSMAANVRHFVASGETNDIELTAVALYDIYRMRYQLWQHLERAGQPGVAG